MGDQWPLVSGIVWRAGVAPERTGIGAHRAALLDALERAATGRVQPSVTTVLHALERAATDGAQPTVATVLHALERAATDGAQPSVATSSSPSG